jgi:single-strand DNA-binding protein
MSDLNRTIIVGRLTRDPELKYTPAGTAVASFSLAVGKTFSQNGQKKEQTSFFNCIAWAKLGETIAEYCKKGHRIGVEGQLQQRRWEDQEGNKKSVVEIVVSNIQFLQGRQEGQQTEQSQPQPEPAMPDWDEDNPFNDSDIPF